MYYFEYFPGTRFAEAFQYTISDGALRDSAQVTVLVDCGCSLEALQGCLNNGGGKTASLEHEAVDLALLRRFRDDVLRPTQHGARYTDLYYNTTPEIAWILIFDRPALGAQAVRMVETLQPALRNVLDGDGSSVITQAQMDSVAAFFANLSAAGSASLQQLIADELTRVGALNDYAGLPVRHVLTAVLGEPVGTPIEREVQPTPADFVLQQNFPNPFQSSTEIRYVLSRPTPVSLEIYNVQGQKVRTLVREHQMPGTYAVTWKGLDDGGAAVSSGVYGVRLQTPTYQDTKRMVFRK